MSSPIFLIPKAGSPGKFRLIQDCSFKNKDGFSVNDFIDSDKFPTRWNTALEVAQIVSVSSFCGDNHCPAIPRAVIVLERSSRMENDERRPPILCYYLWFLLHQFELTSVTGRNCASWCSGCIPGHRLRIQKHPCTPQSQTFSRPATPTWRILHRPHVPIRASIWSRFTSTDYGRHHRHPGQIGLRGF